MIYGNPVRELRGNYVKATDRSATRGTYALDVDRAREFVVELGFGGPDCPGVCSRKEAPAKNRMRTEFRLPDVPNT